MSTVECRMDGYLPYKIRTIKKTDRIQITDKQITGFQIADIQLFGLKILDLLIN
jgi:hypothetical protein